MPSLIGAVFGPKMMAIVYGPVFTAWGCAGIVGPQILAYLKDDFAGQAAHYTFVVGSALLFTVLVITFILNNDKFTVKKLMNCKTD